MENVELTLRFLMKQKQASQILGRNASNIKSLREETGCQVTMSNREHTNRVMTITSKKNISMKAIQRLGEILEAENNAYGKSTRLVPITLTLIVPKNICGMIIGKGGEALKDLRVKSGAQVNMSADCLPKSDERTCQITGNNFAVTSAIDLVVGIMIKAAIDESKGEFKGKPSSEIRAYDPKHQDVAEGRSEKDDKLVQMATAFMTANDMINPHLEYNPIEISETVQELRVPEQHMGAVMGKGGSRISEIRMMSGCAISIERADSSDGSGIRRFTLKGDRQKITMAAFLINQTISSFSSAEPKVKSEPEAVGEQAEETPKSYDPLAQMTSMNTEDQAAAAMSAFFATHFSGNVSYDPHEYAPAPPETEEKTNEENTRGQKRKLPDMYKIPDKKPAKLHY